MTLVRPGLVLLGRLGPTDAAVISLDQQLGRMEAVIEANRSGAAAPPDPWRAMLPGAADLDAFSRIGHCLFAILAGMAGALVSSALYRRENRSAGPEVSGVEIADPVDVTPAL